MHLHKIVDKEKPFPQISLIWFPLPEPKANHHSLWTPPSWTFDTEIPCLYVYGRPASVSDNILLSFHAKSRGKLPALERQSTCAREAIYLRSRGNLPALERQSNCAREAIYLHSRGKLMYLRSRGKLPVLEKQSACKHHSAYDAMKIKLAQILYPGNPQIWQEIRPNKINPNSLDNKGSWRILKDFYCSVTMLRKLGLIQRKKVHNSLNQADY